MYDEVKEGRKDRIQQAINLLTDPDLCYKFMTKVTKEWIHATEQTFTNRSMNHQAFLGQTACNMYAGVKEDETREAWGYLTNDQRRQANKIADQVYDEWEREYIKKSGCYQLSFFD